MSIVTRLIGRPYVHYTVLALLVVTLLFVADHTVKQASAHGKELTITVASFTPDPSDPLTRLYRVQVTYAGDGDPVDDASVVLTAGQTASGRSIEEVELTEVNGETGLYVGELTFTRFGLWEVLVDVKANFGVGEAETVFDENVSPGNLTDAEQAALEFEGERVRRLQVFFKFGIWPDLVNILVRITHSLSGLAYFGAVGLSLTMAWFGIPTRMSRVWSRVRISFLPITMLSLAGILATGAFSMAYDAPVTAPGIYDLDRLFALPYGEWYFAAFVMKPIAWVGLVALAFRVYFVVIREQRQSPVRTAGITPVIAGGADNTSAGFAQPIPGLKGLTFLTIAVAITLVADLAIVIYLHYLSHLGVFLPS